MSTTSGFKSIKVISFDGDEDQFREWRSKSEALGFSNEWWDQVEDSTKAVLRINKATANDDQKRYASKKRRKNVFLSCVYKDRIHINRRQTNSL